MFDKIKKLFLRISNVDYLICIFASFLFFGEAWIVLFRKTAGLLFWEGLIVLAIAQFCLFLFFCLFVLFILYLADRFRAKKSNLKLIAGAGAISLLPFIFAQSAQAEWTPLISAASFTGIETDVLTAVGGIMTICLIVVGAGILIKMLMR